MVATRQRLAALGAGAAGATLLLAAVLHVGVGLGRSSLMSGADADAEILVHRRDAALHGRVGEGGSQLADLIDSPLMLAKQKIDNYLNENSDNLVETARKMNVVGSKPGGAPCTALKCEDGVWQNDYLQTSEDRMDKVARAPHRVPRVALSRPERARAVDSLASCCRVAAGDLRPWRSPVCARSARALPHLALHSRVAPPVSLAVADSQRRGPGEEASDERGDGEV